MFVVDCGTGLAGSIAAGALAAWVSATSPGRTVGVGVNECSHAATQTVPAAAAMATVAF
jgi:hypothetical protein